MIHRYSMILSHYYDVLHYVSQVNSFVGSFHDAVLLYAMALNETYNDGGDVKNGSEITQRMWNRTFKGESPSLIIYTTHQCMITMYFSNYRCFGRVA